MAIQAPNPPKYETLLEENLARARQKIRVADLGRGLLALACLLFGYALVVPLLDLALGGSDSTLVTVVRLAAFGILLVALAWLGTIVGRRALSSVNPRYAARQLEETVPDAKNSLVNWIDLQHESLSPAIRQAVGLRAARDIQEADPELVASPRDFWRLGAAAGILFLGLIVLLALVPRQFGSLMARAFLPLRGSALVSGTTITLLRPAGGNTTVSAGGRVDFLATIEGRVAAPNTPDAPALLYRHDATDAYVRVPLEEDVEGHWGVRLSGDQIRTGLTYKLTAGAAATPEYQITVAAQPFANRFRVRYEYRTYRKVPPETVEFPNEEAHQPRLLAHRGTRVVILARANTPVRSGSLEIQAGGQSSLVRGEAQADDPSSLAYSFVLDRSGTFRLLFESADGVRNVDRNPYPIDVIEDGEPYVEIVKPAKDTEAPANSSVLIAGLAIDDFGIAELNLRLKAEDRSGPRTLAPLPYRPTKPLQAKDGTYSASVSYLDVIPLDQLKDPKGKAVVLAPGSELHYWLEAADNYDNPRPNIGRSKSFKIKIVEPERNQARNQKERDDNQKKKDEHDKKQQQDQGKGDKGQDGKQPGAGKQPSTEEAQKKKLENDLAKTLDKLPDQPQNQDSKNPNPGDSSPGQQNPNDASQPGKDTKDKGSDQNPSNPMGGGKGGNEQKNDPMKSEKDDPGKSGASSKGGQEKDQDQSPDKAAKKKDGNEPGDGRPGATSTRPDSGPSPEPKSDAKGQKTGTPDKGPPMSTNKEGDGQKSEGPTSENAKSVGKPDSVPKSPTRVGKGRPEDEPGLNDPDAKKRPDSTPSAGKGKEKDGKGPEGAADAKDGKDKADITAAKGDDRSKKGPPSREEVDRLKDLLEKGSPEADQAAKDLADRGKDIDDPAIRKALEDTLKNAGREEELKQLGRGEEKAPEPTKIDPVTGQPMTADGAGKGPKEKSNDSEKGTASGKGPGKGKTPGANTGGGAEYEDNITPLAAEEAFRRRLGNLQLQDLDELRKRIGPDDRKKAGIGEDEWQRFLRDAQEYQKLVRDARKREEARDLKKGAAGRLPSTGPRAVQAAPGAEFTPLTSGQALPPPEFQDAQRRFTRKE